MIVQALSSHPMCLWRVRLGGERASAVGDGDGGRARRVGGGRGMDGWAPAWLPARQAGG